MKSNLKAIETPAQIPNDPDSFYEHLTVRNTHFIDSHTQRNLKNLKILIAGCGAGGGACVEPLARLGVTNFRLADNGSYELSNLNRQRTYLNGLGVNKAEYLKSQILQINPFIEATAHAEGITQFNVRELVKWADLIVDAVDVTTPIAIKMKVALHECAQVEAKPVFSMLDVGFCQWGKSFDYRDRRLSALDGKAEVAKNARHPIKALFSMFPISSVPPHCLPLVQDLLEGRAEFASQLGCAADLLSGVIAASVIRYADNGEIASGWNINLEDQAMPFQKRLRARIDSFFVRRRIDKIMKEIE